MSEQQPSAAPSSSTDSSNQEHPAETVERQPVGLIGPEWALRKSARGAALWRHSGVLATSGKESVEVLALDREAKGARFAYRDQWNIPAPGA